MKSQIIETLNKYKEVYPSDLDLPRFMEYLKNNENCIDRKNMNGHIDADALVVENNKVLLIFHKGLQRWLQPGGHIETSDVSLINSAIREVKEETGLDVVPIEGIYSEIPLSLDIHSIPENPKKDEGEHLHYSTMFLLKLKDSSQKIVEQFEEVNEVKWFSFEELEQIVKVDDALGKALVRYKKITNK